jgi:uncharacterized protein (TIGR03118 family)
MHRAFLPRLALFSFLSLPTLASAHEPAFAEIDLVSDIDGRAPVTDPNLVNPWGLVANPNNGPWWVADNGTGLSTLYDRHGTIQSLVVQLEPFSPNPTPAPTGIVFNDDKNNFVFTRLGFTSSAVFLFSSEDGFIEAWDPTVPMPPPSHFGFMIVDNNRKGCHSPTEVDCGSVYKGLAMATDEWGETHLYATDFRNGRVDVFDSNFAPDVRRHAFEDEHLPSGFAPFGIAAFCDRIFVTYALQDEHKHDDVAGPGNGFVDEFDLQGHLIRRVFSRGPLNSPWGLAFAPEGWGRYEGHLLVGNFGDSTINVFRPRHHDHYEFIDALEDEDDRPIVVGGTQKQKGLWAIVFGPGTKVAGSRNALFFTAGINDESDGLFGKIVRVR